MGRDIPPYKRIGFELENDILTGKLRPGHRIPSIRELAAQHRVDPNTARRAVQEVKQEGLLISPCGRGTRVTDDESFIRRFRETRGAEIVRSFFHQMETLGYSREQIGTMAMAGLRDDG